MNEEMWVVKPGTGNPVAGWNVETNHGRIAGWFHLREDADAAVRDHNAAVAWRAQEQKA